MSVMPPETSQCQLITEEAIQSLQWVEASSGCGKKEP